MTDQPDARDGAADQLVVEPLLGVGDVRPGSDLAAVVLASRPADLWLDGDILVVTSKVVSKSEGRIVHADDRDASITAETVDVVAERGTTRIVRTRHGLVLAAAGVDASNTEAGTVLLLPVDPDASARALRAALQAATDRVLGVVISDTSGRPWRNGLTDLAIGAAGIAPLDDHRGRTDAQGRELSMTVTAVADEIAAAAELVKGKAAGRPFAHVRGAARWVTPHDGPGAAALVRPAEDDLFTLGTREAVRLGRTSAVAARRTVRRWTDEPVPRSALEDAVAAAITAPAPHGSTPWGFMRIEGEERTVLLDAMRSQWIADLRGDGWSQEAIDRRVARGDLLRTAPCLLVPYVDLLDMHDYPDERRSIAERDLFVLSAGAAIQSLMVRLAADDWGTAWVSSTAFCPDTVREVLGWNPARQPMGAVAIGRPAELIKPRAPRDPSPFLRLQ